MNASRSFKALTYLSLFALAITVPLLLLAGALLFQSASAQRTQLETRVLQVLDALVSDIDRDLDRDITILRTLATSQALATADWRTFYDQAKAGLQGRAYLVLVDSNGRQLVNTYAPYGEQPAMTGDPETVRRILQTKAPVVSNLFTSLVARKPVFNVSIPILQGGQVRYVMSLGLVPDELLELLKSQDLDSGWVSLISDNNNVILARSRDNPRYVGTPLPGNMSAQPQRAVLRIANLDGADVLHATAHSQVSSWRVGVNIPYSLVTVEMRNSMLLWGAGAVLAIAIALVCGVFFARQITTSLSVAGSAAAAFGHGEPFPLTGSRLKEADAFLATLHNAQQAREKLTDELRQSRDWLQTTLNSIGDGVITTDANGKVSLLNAVAQALTGWTQEEAAGKPLDQVFAITRADTGPEPGDYTWLIARDGCRIPIDDSAAPIQNGGKVVGVVLVFRDITERLKAEERMRLAVEAAPNAMIMVGGGGRIALINSQTEKLFGYERDELLGKSIDILLPERYRTGHEAFRASFLREPLARAMGAGRDLFGLRKDRTEVPLEIGLNPISTSHGDFVLAAIIDVSERKRAEEALRAALARAQQGESLLNAIMDYVPEGITYAEAPDVTIRMVSRYGRELIRKPRELVEGIAAEEHLEKWDIHHLDGTPAANEELPLTRAVKNGEVIFDEEWMVRDSAGREIFILCNAGPIRDAAGNIPGGVITWRDISERKRVEQELRRTTELMGPVACFARDLEGRIVYWNPGAADLYGFSETEAIGQFACSLLKKEFPVSPGKILAQVMSTGAWDGEVLQTTRDGHQLTTASHWALHTDTDGRPAAILEINLDVTDRKEAEVALRKERERLRAALAAGHMAAFERRNDSNIWWSPEMYDIMGVSPEHFTPTGETSLQLVHPEDRESLVRGFQESVAEHKPYIHEVRIIRPDGSVRWVGNWAESEYDDTGRLQRYFGVTMDITQRKEAEEKLRVSNAALSRANDDLKQFAFAASHDLQEPLRMITSYSQLLLKSYGGQLEPQAVTFLEFITAGSKRMRELLTDLLAYTQVANESEATAERVDLNQVFQLVLENCRVAIQESQATVTSDRLPIVEGQEPYFIQLLQNLISNGLKYRAADRPPRIHISTERQGSLWRIAVNDNGIGIAPEYHAQIFGVFKRLHGKTISGTGIGLAICQRVVDRYGGKIWVDSQVDQGATFYFTLPAPANE